MDGGMNSMDETAHLIADGAHPQTLMFNVDYPDNPKVYFDRICNEDTDARSNYHVTELVLYKETADSEHEFVVATLSNSSQLLVERMPNPDAMPKHVISTSSPPPSRKIVDAYDVVRSIPPSSTLDTRSAKEVGRCTFEKLPVLEFARLVDIISNHKRNYVLNDSMCYWFASAIVEIAKRQFGDSNSSLPSGLAGHFRGLPVHSSDWKEDFDNIEKEYVQAKKKNPEPIGPVQAEFLRLKKEANEAKERYEREQYENSQKTQQLEQEVNEANRAKDRAQLETEKIKQKVHELGEEIRRLQQLGNSSDQGHA